MGINIGTLSASFKHNVVDVDSRAEQLKQNELNFDDLSLKLTISVETSHCEVCHTYSCAEYRILYCTTLPHRISLCLVMKFVHLWPPSRRLLCTLFGARCTTNLYFYMWHSSCQCHVFRIIFSKVREEGILYRVHETETE